MGFIPFPGPCGEIIADAFGGTATITLNCDFVWEQPSGLYMSTTTFNAAGSGILTLTQLPYAEFAANGYDFTGTNQFIAWTQGCCDSDPEFEISDLDTFGTYSESISDGSCSSTGGFLATSLYINSLGGSNYSVLAPLCFGATSGCFGYKTCSDSGDYDGYDCTAVSTYILDYSSTSLTDMEAGITGEIDFPSTACSGATGHTRITMTLNV